MDKADISAIIPAQKIEINSAEDTMRTASIQVKAIRVSQNQPDFLYRYNYWSDLTRRL